MSPECGWAPESKNSPGSIMIIFSVCLWHVYIHGHAPLLHYASVRCSSSQNRLWSSLVNYLTVYPSQPFYLCWLISLGLKNTGKNDQFSLLSHQPDDTFPLFLIEVELFPGNYPVRGWGGNCPHQSQELCSTDMLSGSKDLILALRYGDLKKYHLMYRKSFI